MKRTISTLVLLTILLLLTVSALAQDDATAVPTDVPAATQEATALETEQAIATQEVVVIVTQTPEQSPTPTLTPTDEPVVVPPVVSDPPIIVEIPAAESTTPWSVLFNIALLIFIAVREFQHSGKVALSTVEKIIGIGRRYAATTTGTTMDDAAVDMVEAIALAMLKRQDKPVTPTTPGGVSPQG